MAFAFNNTIQNIRLRFVNGSAGQFFQWWVEELRNAMPTSFRARIQYARRRLLIQLGEGDISLAVDDDLGCFFSDFAKVGNVDAEGYQRNNLRGSVSSPISAPSSATLQRVSERYWPDDAANA